MKTKAKPNARIKMWVKQMKQDNKAFKKKVKEFKAACDAYEKNHVNGGFQKKETLL